MLRDSRALDVLMLSLATGLVTYSLGDDLERHVAYAERVKHLHIVVYTPRGIDGAPVHHGDHLTLYPTRSFSRYSFIWDAYRIGARLCRSQNIDVISTQDPFTTGLAGVWLKRRVGVPLHLNNHSTYFGNPHWLAESPLRNRVLERIGRWVVPRADTLRVSNPDQRNRSIAMGMSPENIEVVHIPVPLEHFRTPPDSARVEALRGQLHIPPDGNVVLWVGRLVPVKRLPDLIEAFALLRRSQPQAHLLLVGDLGDSPEVQAQINRLGIEPAVRCPGLVAHDDLPAYYALADVFSLSSVYEGLPRVVVEAMASGLPIVGTRIPALEGAVLDGETGLLCQPENAEDLASKLDLLLSNPDRAQAMGQRGRARALENFDWERMMDTIVGLWARTAAFRERGA